MNMQLRWKNRIFKDFYEISSGYSIIGTMKNKFWSQSAIVEINNKKYEFRTKGFFRQFTSISQMETNTEIGKISYNLWGNKAKIELYSGKVYDWKFDNLWGTKFSLSESNMVLIDYSGSYTNGKINSITDDLMLILTGLFVMDYHEQLVVSIALVTIAVSITSILR